MSALRGVASLAVLLLIIVPRAGATGPSPDAFFFQNWEPDSAALVIQTRSSGSAIQRVTLAGEMSMLVPGVSYPVRLSARGDLAYVATGDATRPQGKLTVRDGRGRTRVIATAFETGGLAWSPDGAAIAFQSANRRLAIVGLDGRDSRVLAHSGNDPSWSSDGTRIAFVRGDETTVVELATGVARPVGPASAAMGSHVAGAYPAAAWSPDGSRLAIQLDNGIQVVRSDGSGPAASFPKAGGPSWSPDGAQLAMSRKNDIVLSRLGDSSLRTLVGSGMTELAPTWSPDGHWIAYTNYNVTPSGQAYRRGHAADVFVVRPDGTGRRSLTGGCGVRPETPVAWICLVNGSWAVPPGEAHSPVIRVAPRFYPRAIRLPVYVNDRDRHVYGARVTVTQLSGPTVRVTSVTGKPPRLLTDSGGRAAFRFLKPRKHGIVTLEISAAGRARVVRLHI